MIPSSFSKSLLVFIFCSNQFVIMLVCNFGNNMPFESISISYFQNRPQEGSDLQTKQFSLSSAGLLLDEKFIAILGLDAGQIDSLRAEIERGDVELDRQSKQLNKDWNSGAEARLINRLKEERIYPLLSPRQIAKYQIAALIWGLRPAYFELGEDDGFAGVRSG